MPVLETRRRSSMLTLQKSVCAILAISVAILDCWGDCRMSVLVATPVANALQPTRVPQSSKLLFCEEARATSAAYKRSRKVSKLTGIEETQTGSTPTCVLVTNITLSNVATCIA